MTITDVIDDLLTVLHYCVRWCADYTFVTFIVDLLRYPTFIVGDICELTLVLLVCVGTLYCIFTPLRCARRSVLRSVWC